MLELPAVPGAEWCLRAAYWGACTNWEEVAFDRNGLEKGGLLKEVMSVAGGKQERTI